MLLKLLVSVIVVLSLFASLVAASGPFANAVEVFRRIDAAEVTLAMSWYPGRCPKLEDRSHNHVRCEIDALRPFWTIKEVKGQLKNCETYGNERSESTELLNNQTERISKDSG